MSGLTEKQIKEMAARVAADLMTPGGQDEEKAYRLKMFTEEGECLAGYSESGLCTRIAALLSEELNQKSL